MSSFTLPPARSPRAPCAGPLRRPRRASAAAAAAPAASAESAAAPPPPPAARAARAAGPGEPAQTLPVFYDPATSRQWHYVLANADFMLNDENSEHLPEVLRERRRFFLENDATSNFFVVPNPAWLDADAKLAARVRRPAVAVVSPDAVWIRRADEAAADEAGRAVRAVAAAGVVAEGDAAQPPRPRPARGALSRRRPTANRYLKLRLDRVLIGQLEGGVDEITKSTAPLPPFPQPASWAAPCACAQPGGGEMRVEGRPPLRIGSLSRLSRQLEICPRSVVSHATCRQQVQPGVVVDVRVEAVSAAALEPRAEREWARAGEGVGAGWALDGYCWLHFKSPVACALRRAPPVSFLSAHSSNSTRSTQRNRSQPARPRRT